MQGFTNAANSSNSTGTSSYPFGVPIPWLSSKIPAGCIVLDGRAVSRTTYADLFDIWGTTFGEGDGNTTFNLPNLQGRTLVGLDLSDSDFLKIGNTGGEKVHTLTSSEMPDHRHSYYEHSTNSVGVDVGNEEIITGINSSYSTVSSKTDSAGEGNAHNNMQPYFVVRYICMAIK